MSKFSFENQGPNTYLVYSLGEDDVIDSMTLGMLTHNKIQGLAPTTFTQLDAQKYLKYNVSAKSPAKVLFGGVVNRKRLLGVFKGIVDAMLSAEEYMIEPNSILLDTQYIFSDVTSGETILICLPIENHEETPDLKGFFKDLTVNTQFDMTEGIEHVAEILNYLNGATPFSLTTFKALLEELEGNRKKAQPTGTTGTSGKISKLKTTTPSQPVRQQPAVDASPRQPNVGSNQGSGVGMVGQGAERQIPAKKQTVETPPVKTTPSVSSTAGKADDSDRITLYYLLQHYNSENAAKYKAQKEADKAAKTQGSKHTSTTKKQKSAEKKQRSQGAQVTFSVPGQETELKPMSEDRPQQASEPIVQKQQPVVAESQPVQQRQTSPAPVRQTNNFSSFGETVDLRNLGDRLPDTTIDLKALANNGIAPLPKRAFLIRCSNNERIQLKAPEFRLGRDPEFADYCFNERDLGVGKSHAIIYSRDGQYSVMDLNSRNHTFVNGEQISSSTEYAIQSGDAIRFANIDFDFKVE